MSEQQFVNDLIDTYTNLRKIKDNGGVSADVEHQLRLAELKLKIFDVDVEGLNAG